MNMASSENAVVKIVLIMSVAYSVLGNAVLTPTADTESEQTRMLQQNLFKSFDDVTNFLRGWFQRLKSDRTQSTPVSQTDLSKRSKRSVIEMLSGVQPVVNIEANQTSFEELEKAFLINRTMMYLKQIYFYTKDQSTKKDNDNSIGETSNATVTSTGSVRTDPLLEHWMQQLGKLDAHQITSILNNARRSAELGVEQADVSSLCCNIG
ncbi:hypothetical protein DPMN_145719 [Dreissena polymorpha]|uniref:Uncharacterized protein n=1 Tax=Dreissena polymorpha TaxID=45954 RepID=A0A9D4J1G8_DREPO|nr:hypothetical protein DPMN_145719 [Dreissena polymorpha]